MREEKSHVGGSGGDRSFSAGKMASFSSREPGRKGALGAVASRLGGVVISLPRYLRYYWYGAAADTCVALLEHPTRHPTPNSGLSPSDF